MPATSRAWPSRLAAVPRRTRSRAPGRQRCRERPSVGLVGEPEQLAELGVPGRVLEPDEGDSTGRAAGRLGKLGRRFRVPLESPNRGAPAGHDACGAPGPLAIALPERIRDPRRDARVALARVV